MRRDQRQARRFRDRATPWPRRHPVTPMGRPRVRRGAPQWPAARGLVARRRRPHTSEGQNRQRTRLTCLWLREAPASLRRRPDPRCVSDVLQALPSRLTCTTANLIPLTASRQRDQPPRPRQCPWPGIKGRCCRRNGRSCRRRQANGRMDLGGHWDQRELDNGHAASADTPALPTPKAGLAPAKMN